MATPTPNPNPPRLNANQAHNPNSLTETNRRLGKLEKRIENDLSNAIGEVTQEADEGRRGERCTQRGAGRWRDAPHRRPRARHPWRSSWHVCVRSDPGQSRGGSCGVRAKDRIHGDRRS
jgi:hypothetical protein